MARYRRKLDEIAEGLDLRPSEDDRWSTPHGHEWFVLNWNAKRLAVHDRDIEAIIRTHARDRRVAAWLQDTAEAFEEIGEIDLLEAEGRARFLELLSSPVPDGALGSGEEASTGE
mgnify:CR=1 FL=1